MEIGLFILILLVYLVPMFLKRLKKKEPYRYPETAGIPGTLAQGVKPPPVPLQINDRGESGKGKDSEEVEPHWGLQLMHDAPVLAGDSGGGAAFNPALAGQAVVWAEIIAPPIALRLARGQRRRF